MLAAAVVLAGLGVGLYFGLRSNDSGEATALITPTTATSSAPAGASDVGETTSTTTGAGPLSGLADWSATVLLPVVGDSARVLDLTTHDGVLVAVGAYYVGENERPAVWRSRDGVSWEVIETAGLDLDRSRMTRVVSGKGWLAAIGEWSEPTASGGKDYHAIGWTSVDGVTWRRIATLPVTADFERATGLARVGDEVWIVGVSFGRSEHDLTDFRVAPDGTVYGPNAPADVRSGAVPLVDRSQWGTLPRPFLFRSDLGDSWVDVPLTGVEFAELQAVEAGDDGAPLLAGIDPDKRSAVWRRDDDGSWKVLPRPVPNPTPSVRSITARDGIVVLAANGPSGATLTPDGTWATLPGLTITDLAALDDRFVGVAWVKVETSDVDPTYRPYVVESTDGAAWSAVELPSNEFAMAITPFGDRLVACGYALSDDSGTVPAAWVGGSHDTMETGEPLSPADWQPPIVPGEPFADLLRFDGASWVAELTNVDLGDARVVGETAELDLDRANDLVIAGDGSVWVSTEQHGVYCLRQGAWTRYGTEEGLPVESARWLASGPGSTVVAATRTGLAVFDGSGFSTPVMPEAITDPRVIDLVGDGATVWAATASGLISWDGSTWRHHGEADGLPVPAVVGGDLPAGLALRLFPTDSGVVAQFPGVGFAGWDGSTWKVFDLPPRTTVVAVGWDGSVIYAGEPDDVRRVTIFRRHPDGSEERLAKRVQFATAALARDGTLFVTENLGGLYTVRDGSTVRSGTLGGVKLGYVGRVWAVGDLAVLRGGSAVFVYRNGAWTAHTNAVGLDYPLGGSDNSFSTGAVYDVAAGPDGTVWALSIKSVPEWLDP